MKVDTMILAYITHEDNKKCSLKQMFSKYYNPDRCMFEGGVVVKQNMQMIKEVLACSEDLNTFDLASICAYIEYFEECWHTKESVIKKLDDALQEIVSSYRRAGRDLSSSTILHNQTITHFACCLLGWNDYCLMASASREEQKFRLVKEVSSDGKRLYYIETEAMLLDKEDEQYADTSAGAAEKQTVDYIKTSNQYETLKKIIDNNFKK